MSLRCKAGDLAMVTKAGGVGQIAQDRMNAAIATFDALNAEEPKP